MVPSLASGRWDPRWVGLRRLGVTTSPVSPGPRPRRPLDISGQGYNNWTFMSSHYWDENPQGLWTLGLENKGYYFNTGEAWLWTASLGAGDPASADPQPQRALGVSWRSHAFSSTQ